MRLIATLHDPAVIRKILAHLALYHSGQSPGLGPAMTEREGVVPQATENNLPAGLALLVAVSYSFVLVAFGKIRCRSFVTMLCSIFSLSSGCSSARRTWFTSGIAARRNQRHEEDDAARIAVGLRVLSDCVRGGAG